MTVLVQGCTVADLWPPCTVAGRRTEGYMKDRKSQKQLCKELSKLNLLNLHLAANRPPSNTVCEYCLLGWILKGKPGQEVENELMFSFLVVSFCLGDAKWRKSVRVWPPYVSLSSRSCPSVPRTCGPTSVSTSTGRYAPMVTLVVSQHFTVWKTMMDSVSLCLVWRVGGHDAVSSQFDTCKYF